MSTPENPRPAFAQAAGSPAVEAALGLGWLRREQRQGGTSHPKWSGESVRWFVENVQRGMYDEQAVIILTEEVLRLRCEVLVLDIKPTPKAKARKRKNHRDMQHLSDNHAGNEKPTVEKEAGA